MKPAKHITAKASHYNTSAQSYDEFNEYNSKATNAILEKILKAHNVSTVLDLTCGTGSQVFWLANAGLEVVGSDINLRMLKIAKQKAKTFTLVVSML
jgi:ubiquinone/menaquinone biosynthesis C-methylase UbiE